MKVNKKYLLPESTTLINKNKDKIIIGNSFTSDSSYFNTWLRCNKYSKIRTSNYSIDKDGIIYQHTPSNQIMSFTNEIIIDKDSVSITLINEGWLIKHNKKMVNLNGHDYLGDFEMQRWRGMNYWAKYPETQLKSLSKLILFLSEKYSIYKLVHPHYVIIDDIKTLSGVFFRGNITDHYTDVNATFDNELLNKYLKWIK